MQFAGRTWKPVDPAVLLVAAAIAVGAFLPWVKVSAGPFSDSAPGTDGDGILTLILAAVAAVVTVWGIYGNAGPRVTAVLLVVAGGMVAGIGGYDWADVHNQNQGIEADLGISASAGIGLIITVVAGVLLMALAYAGYWRPALVPPGPPPSLPPEPAETPELPESEAATMIGTPDEGPQVQPPEA